MKLKKKIIVIIFLLTTITISIINLQNTSKTYLNLLNFKSEKLSLGTFITLSFLAGLTTSITFSYLINEKKENILIDFEKLDLDSDISQGTIKENHTEKKEFFDERPPERDIRESQPTISVNYRVIKQNNMDVKDINEEYTDNKYQNIDDWEEIESNW